jgi:hypothetical protein
MTSDAALGAPFFRLSVPSPARPAHASHSSELKVPGLDTHSHLCACSKRQKPNSLTEVIINGAALMQ